VGLAKPDQGEKDDDVQEWNGEEDTEGQQERKKKAMGKVPVFGFFERASTRTLMGPASLDNG